MAFVCIGMAVKPPNIEDLTVGVKGSEMTLLALHGQMLKEINHALDVEKKKLLESNGGDDDDTAAL